MQFTPTALHNVLEAERGRLALWLPVCMGAGVAWYFALRHEPPPWIGMAIAIPAVAAALLARARPLVRAVLAAIAAASIGCAAAQLATFHAPPIEPLPTHAVILTGNVFAVDKLPDGRRIVLTAASLDAGQPPLRRMLRVRLRSNDGAAVAAGDTVRVRALLRPPAAPAYPGARDLQRDAFFTGLAGSGFALGPLEVLNHQPPIGLAHRVQGLRDAIGHRIADVLPGASGAVAATLLTGTQTAISEPDRAAFRDSGLSHLLAVAGLHIGIVMGWVMLATRSALAASERAALFWPCKQLAAAAALIAGGCYMALTGMHLPIMRSFAMALLFTLALLAGRRAVSMRGLAVAAVILMLVTPQDVPGVSFQLSFSAVLALIAGYEALRPHLARLRNPASWWRRLMLYVLALALTSLLAGGASAPFAAYHFGQVQIYFVLANMLAVPLTALFVLPAGLLALALMPFGLERLALLPMGFGCDAILWVARTTSALPAATWPVPPIPLWGLLAVALGMAWLGIWRTPMRLAGIAVIALGLASPLLLRSPDILVSDEARLIGVRTRSGVFLQSISGASKITREEWLRYWGAETAAVIPTDGAAADGAISCAGQACLLWPRVQAKPALLLRGADRPDDCARASVIVSAEPARGRCPRPYPALVDRFTVWRQGAAAIWLERDSAVVLTDRENRGDRPWVTPVPVPRAARVPTLPLAPTH